nr:unnamed protein product [Callosobruchus analis]
MIKACPLAAEVISKELLGEDCAFRHHSDNVLQFVCGKRSEAIELRRKHISFPNHANLLPLNKIPPSESHLFDEAKLEEALRTQNISLRPSFKRKYPYSRQEQRPQKITRKPEKRYVRPPQSKEKRPPSRYSSSIQGPSKQDKSSKNRIGRLHCRRLQIASKVLPKTLFPVPQAVLKEMYWWLTNLEKKSEIFHPAPQVFLTTDASNAGWGAHIMERTVSGTWTSKQTQWHINLKEMFVIYQAILLYKSSLVGKTLLIQSDNQTVVAYIRNQGWLHYIRGWSDVDVKLLEKAWRPSTLKTYSTAWKRWTEWAKNESIDINEPKPEDVALFLSFLHRVKGLSSSTILVNKSVITSFADPVRAEAISNHPIVKLLDWLKTNTPDEDNKTSLFDDGIQPQVINKLRFALPTVGLEKAFNPEAKSLSEKTYREMKLRMLNWPFCIGLVIGPPALASKIRGAELKHELVMSSQESVKPLLVSRVEASRQLAEDTSDVESTSTNGTKAVRGKKEGWLDRLEQIYESSDDYDLEDHDDQENVAPSLDLGLEESNSTEVAVVPPETFDFNFVPETKEQEPLIPRPDVRIEAQGVTCLLLGQGTYNRIRYAEAQKKLQASPVFSALQINPQLAVTSQNRGTSDQLSQTYAMLGTILHGLLVQREAFSNAVKALTAKYPEIKRDVKDCFWDTKGDFKVISDDLVQYVSGKRAEVIEKRRKALRPRNTQICALLDAIPPSKTHLFEEDSLTDLIRQHGQYPYHDRNPATSQPYRGPQKKSQPFTGRASSSKSISKDADNKKFKTESRKRTYPFSTGVSNKAHSPSVRVRKH